MQPQKKKVRKLKFITGLEGGDPSIDKDSPEQEKKIAEGLRSVRVAQAPEEPENSIDQSNEVLLKPRTPRDQDGNGEVSDYGNLASPARLGLRPASSQTKPQKLKKDIDSQKFARVTLANSKKSDSASLSVGKQASIEPTKKISMKVNDVTPVSFEDDVSKEYDSPLNVGVNDIGMNSIPEKKQSKASRKQGASKGDSSLLVAAPEPTATAKSLLTHNKSKAMRDHEKELWVQLQSHNRYSDETVRSYASLKNVFKKRAQFSEATEKFKKRLEIRYQIGHQEMAQVTHKLISISSRNEGSQNKSASNDDDNSDTEVETETLWRRFKKAYEDSMMMVKDETCFYVHGQYFVFSKSSLAIMTNRSQFRWAFVWLVTWKQFETAVIVLIGLNSITLGIKDYTDKENVTQRNIIVESMDPFFSYLFLIECICKIIGMGWLFGTNAYLTDGWNWLDFIVVITSILNDIPGMSGVSGLRTFRLFRPLRSLTTMPSMRVLIGTLMESVAQLVGIMGLTLFFFLIFSILGVSLLNGLSHFRCYKTEWPDPDNNWLWETHPDDTRLCGQYRSCPTGYYCNSRFVALDKGHLPSNTTDASLWKDTDIADLNYGITNFDDIRYAFLTIFQCITMEGWTKIMNIYQDAYHEWFIITYFMLCIIICSVFLLNLTIAVMLMKYEELDKEQESGQSDIGKKKGQEAVMKEPSHNEELRMIGEKIKLPQTLINFLIDQQSIQMQDGAQKMLRQEDSFFQQLMAPKKGTVDLSNKYYKNKCVQWCYRRIMDPYFDAFILLAIILNTITLALDKYPSLPDWSLFALSICNYVFTAIFTIECILKMIGLGIREFLREGFNQFDLLIVIISIAEMFQDGPGVFSAFRAIRLFKIFKHFQAGDLRILIGSITFTLSTIGDYVILLLLFMYVFALLGMSFFAGAVKFDANDQLDLENGIPPRANFDSILWAGITIFEVLMGESWNSIMYQGIRGQGYYVSIYFIMLFMIGSIIMLNLFLAILLGNFEKARNFGMKKQVFDAFREIMGNGHTLNDALDIILGDMSGHVKEKVLRWDKKQVERIHKVGDSKMMHQMLEEGQKFQTMNEEEPGKNNLISQHVERPVDKLLDEVGPDGAPKKNTLSARQMRKQQVNRLNISSKTRDNLFDKDNTRANKYSYTVEVRHKVNTNIKRQREMNRQFKIKPYVGLKEILMKKQKLDGDLSAVDSDDYKDFAQLEKERKAKGKQSLRISTSLQKLSLKNDNMVSPPVGSSLYGTADATTNPVLMNLKKSLKENSKEKPIIESKFKRSKSVKIGSDKQLNVQNLNRSTMGLTGQARNTSMFKSTKVENDLSSSQRMQHQEANMSCQQRFINSLRDRSLFIFHRDSKLRQWCLQLAETPEILHKMKKLIKDGTIEDYDPANDQDVHGKVAPEDGQGKQKDEDKDKKEKMVDEENSPYKKFDYFILILIVLSSITLVIDNPLNDPESGFMKILKIVDIVFTVLFFLEAAVKIIARGFLFNRLGPVEPYIRSAWNFLDFFVVTASSIDLAFMIAGADSSQFQALKAFRVLRALRPLRVISKDPGMKLVVNALLASIPSMTNVLLVCSLIILIFSIMGVSFFKGAFYSCQENPLKPVELDLAKIITKQNCLDQGGIWVNQHQNFDDCLSAMSTLFQMMTTEGWLDVMEAGIDSQGVDLQPKYNSNLFMLSFFIIFMIIGSQFIINLFVGVVIDNFQTIKEKEELDNMFVTEQQRSWIEIQKVGQSKALKVKIEAPTGFREPFYNLVDSALFEHTITFFILANTIFMALKSYRMNPVLEEVSEQANWVFAFVFNLEMVLKLIGLGKIYFLYAWNNFDMIIVIATDLGLLLRMLNLGATFSEAASIVRGFRIMRMFKLIRTSLTIRLILDTVANILPQIKNVMTLIMLLLFIFAALGINLFSQVMLQENLNEKNNFKSFGNAIVILMSFSTGEDWNAFMYELANRDGYNGVKCIDQQSYAAYRDGGFVTKQCGSGTSLLYFFAFTVIVSILIMNLSVAAVIEGLDTAKKENMGVVQGDEIDELLELWQEYDPAATGFITTKSLVFLLYELKPPLGRRSKTFEDENAMEESEVSKSKGRKEDRYLVNYEKGIVMRKREALNLLKDLKIRVNTDSKVHFVDVFRALIKRIFEDQAIDYKLSPNLNKKIKSQWSQKHTDSRNGFDPNYKFTASEQQAGQIIVRWGRSILSKLKYQQRGMNTKIKGDKLSKKGTAKQKQDTTQPQEALQEQARIIQNIILQRPDDADDLAANVDHAQGRRRARWAQQRWKQVGGAALWAQLDNDMSQTGDDMDGSSSDHSKHYFKGSQQDATNDETKPIKSNSHSGEDVESADKATLQSKQIKKAASPLKQIETANEKPNAEAEDLFGPDSKTVAAEFQEGKFEQGQLKEVLRDATKLNERVQIILYDLEKERPDPEARQVYEPDKKGHLQRNYKIERTDRVLEARRRVNRAAELGDNVFGQRADPAQIAKINARKQALAAKAQDRRDEEILEEKRQGAFGRDWRLFDAGFSGKTIEMDERFVEGESMHKMNKMIENDFHKLKGEEVDDLTHGRAGGAGLLRADPQPIEDLLAKPQEKNYLPASARGHKHQSRHAQQQMAKSVPNKDGLLGKPGERTAGGSPRDKINPLPQDDDEKKEDGRFKLQKIQANNLFENKKEDK